MSAPTPDLDWDETTRPTLGDQDETTFAPGGEAAAHHLVEVHDALRAELTQVRDIVSQVRLGLATPGAARAEINAMTMRQNNWTLGAYCASYCRFVNAHHTLEDQGVFPFLRQSEPAAAPVLDRLQQEHEVIHVVLEGVDRALVGLVSTEVTDEETPGLDEVERLADALLSHLSYEERELRGPLARHGFF